MRALTAVALVALVGCRPKPYPVHADLDTSDPNLLRVNVSSLDEGTVTLMGTSGKTDITGRATFVISKSQIPPGPHFLTVSMAVGEGRRARRGSTIVELNRLPIEPTVTVGTKDYRSNAIKCTGEACAGDLDTSKEGKLAIPVDAPPGCKVQILDQSVTIPVRYERFTQEETYTSTFSETPKPSEALPKLEVELKTPVLDAMLPDALQSDKAPPVELTAKVTCDHDSASAKFKVDGGPLYRHAMATLFERVPHGGVTFEGGDASAGSPTSALVVRGSGVWFLGKPSKIRDVDLVAFSETQSRSGGQCGPYKTYGSGQTFSAPLTLHDETVRIYDRRSGKLLKEQKLLGYGTCPDYLSGTSYGGSAPSASVSGDVDSSRIDALVKPLLK